VTPTKLIEAANDRGPNVPILLAVVRADGPVTATILPRGCDRTGYRLTTRVGPGKPLLQLVWGSEAGPATAARRAMHGLHPHALVMAYTAADLGICAGKKPDTKQVAALLAAKIEGLQSGKVDATVRDWLASHELPKAPSLPKAAALTTVAQGQAVLAAAADAVQWGLVTSSALARDADVASTKFRSRTVAPETLTAADLDWVLRVRDVLGPRVKDRAALRQLHAR